MTTITVSSKGQITVPVALREALKLHTGSVLQASVDAQGRLVLVPELYEPKELFEDRPAVSRRLTVEEIDDAIGRAVR